MSRLDPIPAHRAAVVAAPANGQYATLGLLREPDDCGFTVRRYQHDAMEPHDHLFHEIVFVESGSADHLTAEGSRRLRPGDVIIIRPQIWHGYAAARGLGIINCLIDSELMRRLAPFHGRIGGAFELFRKRPRDPRNTPPTVLHAATATAAEILATLEIIMVEQRERRDGWQDAATARLLEILVTVARLMGRAGAAPLPAPVLFDRTHQGVLDIASYIEAHFTAPIRLLELSERVHLSPGHLSRSFSRRMGMGIVQYLHRMRAEEACRLLRCTDESISQIAARVGYDEIAYFSRCFRAHIHQSPMQYRNSLRR